MPSIASTASYLDQYRPELARHRLNYDSDSDTSELGIRERRKLRAASYDRPARPSSRPRYDIPTARPRATTTAPTTAAKHRPPPSIISDTDSTYSASTSASSASKVSSSSSRRSTSSRHQVHEHSVWGTAEEEFDASPPPPPPPPLIDPVQEALQEKLFNMPRTIYFFAGCKHQEAIGLERNDGTKARRVIRQDACGACIAAREAARRVHVNYETKVRKGETGGLKYVRVRK